MFSNVGGQSGAHPTQPPQQQQQQPPPQQPPPQQPHLHHHPQQQQQQQHGPIKLQGFDIPASSSTTTTSSTNSSGGNSHASPSTNNPTSPNTYSVDPSMLFGFQQHGGCGHGASPLASSSSYKTVSPPPFATSGTAAFSDLDLEFETTLASLAQHHQQHQHQQQQQQQQHHHQSLGSGLYRLNGDNTAAASSAHSSHLANQSYSLSNLGQYSGPGSPYAAYDARAFGGMPTYLTIDGDPPPPPVSASTASSTNAARIAAAAALAGGTAPVMTISLSNHAASSPHDSRLNVRSPTTPTTPLVDLFGNPLSPTNPDSPHAATAQQQRRSSQVAQEFGSYSSSYGEGLGSASAVPVTQGIPPKASSSSSSSSALGKRRGSGVVMPGSPEVGKSLSSNHGRSRSAGVGKAPTSRARSRSARRNGSVAYSTNGPAAASSNSVVASANSPTQASAMSAAIAIPAVKGGNDGGSSSVPKNNSQHQLAMSMPAYPGAGPAVGNNRQDCFASPQAIPGATASFKSGIAGEGSRLGSLGTSASSTTTMDAESGWRPSGTVGVPSSAPVLGSSKKGKMTLDDVPEDPTQKQAALLTEKRRKRRESHNAVERRRRDNINDRITELASLLPEVLLDQVNSASSAAAAKAAASGVSVDDLDEPTDGSFAALSLLSPDPSTGMGLSNGILGTSPTSAMLGTSRQMTQGAGAAAAATMGKPNKGIILQKSVEYIRYLQQLLELHLQRGAALEHRVSELEAGRSGLEHDSGIDGIRSKDSRSGATTSPGIRSPSASNGSEGLFEFSPSSTTGPGRTTTDGQGWIIPKEEEMDQS
ncbi:BQ2448_8058 [Microbotryum intermedium]|uniref:BQ2448_8058 protein n=1 Tax=Microbotryum intermedium TaxID=269621 RepID=A0A238FNQ7_9BASI|nr:BQ2448_8058 [Microbotryum intermedium]